jgi:N-acyl-D-aspartate/D-glutamate deacylase
MRTAGYREVEALPFAEKVKRMQDPAMRARILAEMPGDMSSIDIAAMTNYDVMYEFTGDYEPGPEMNLAARAAKLGVEPVALAYDILTAGDGTAALCMPAVNFSKNSIEAVETMIRDENTILGLGDGGAHCGMICDGSLPTHMIERWSDAGRGDLPIAQVIKALSSETAEAIGLRDRGLIKPGYRADLNVIDTSKIGIGRHEIVADLPDGGRRLHQNATGYDATIVAGEVTYRNGVATGALPGRLVRGAQPVPA